MRKNKLTLPALQLQLAGYSLGLVSFALIFQYVLVTSSLSELVLAEADFIERQELVTSKALEILLISLGVILPLTLVVGILSTFRIAGPLTRFSSFLTSFCRGENPGRIRLRKNDKLHELAELINQATVDIERTPATSERDEEHSMAA